MIDYGLSKFSTKVAAAAAGRRAQEVVEALHDRCASQRCTVFGSESSVRSGDVGWASRAARALR